MKMATAFKIATQGFAYEYENTAYEDYCHEVNKSLECDRARLFGEYGKNNGIWAGIMERSRKISEEALTV